MGTGSRLNTVRAGNKGRQMLRLFRVIFVLFVLLAGLVVGYAYLGDLSPDRQDVSVPVELDGN